MTDLLTSAQVVEAIGLTGTQSTRDTALIGRIAAAIGPVIEDLCGSILPADKTQTTDGGRRAVLLPYRPNAVSQVTENGAAITDFYVDNDAAIVYAGSRAQPRCFAVGEVVVTYTVGVASVDGDGNVTGVDGNVLFAAYEQCRIWWQQGQQSLHVAYGYDAEGPASVPMGFAVSARVRELLAPNPNLPGFA